MWRQGRALKAVVRVTVLRTLILVLHFAIMSFPTNSVSLLRDLANP